MCPPRDLVVAKVYCVSGCIFAIAAKHRFELMLFIKIEHTAGVSCIGDKRAGQHVAKGLKFE